VFAGKSDEKREKLDWKPLYLDAQATTPMVVFPALLFCFASEKISVFYVVFEQFTFI